MKVALLGAFNYHAPGRRYQPCIPLGLLSLAAYLRREGFGVRIVDPNLVIEEGVVPMDGSLLQGMADYLGSLEADAVGFSTLGNSYHMVLRTAEHLRARAPGLPIVLGGPQATVADEDTLREFPAVDVIVRGEGELTFAELLHCMEDGLAISRVAGLTFRQGGDAVQAQERPLIGDLDSLPLPAYDLYPFAPEAGIPLDVGRGCPFDCAFCSTCHFWRRRSRLKSNDRIIDEIRTLRERYGASVFSIPHDLFAIDRRRVIDFCGKLRAERLPLLWTCFGRIDCMDEEMLDALSSAGCINVGYGVESGSETVQRYIGKNLPPARVEEIVGQTLRRGMGTVVSFIVGFPPEEREDLRATCRLIKALFLAGRGKVHVGCSTLIPYGGSRLFREFRGELAWNGLEALDTPGTPFDAGSIALMRSHPTLFSAFHHIPCERIPRKDLEDIAEFAVIPLQAAPATVIALWREHPDTLELHRLWRAFNARRAAPYVTDAHRGDGNRLFAATFMLFVKSLRREGLLEAAYLCDLATYETVRFLLSAGRPAARPQEDLCEGAVGDMETLAMLRPARNGFVRCVAFDYDVEETARSLIEEGAPPSSPPVRTVIAFNCGFSGVVLTERLDPAAHRLLMSADGHASAGELLKEFPSGERARLGSLMLRWLSHRMLLLMR